MRVLAIDEARVDEFIELSWRINAADPGWIPPMRQRLRQELIGADAFGRYATVRLFGCESGSQLVGRVAALVNPHLVDGDGCQLGQVGYFESIDDAGVAASLFAAAADWLCSKGVKEVRGPMNGGAHRPHRLMTSGFDREPFLFEPRNPEYYPQLFQNSGFAAKWRWRSFDVTTQQLAAVLGTVGALRMDGRVVSRYHLDRPDPADPRPLLVRMHEQLDRLWMGHVGYASLDLPEFAEVFAPVLSLMNHGDLIALVDRETGTDVGFEFSYPDYATEVRAIDGDAKRWGEWHSHATRPPALVIHTIALVREARHTGASRLLLRRCFEHCIDSGYERGVMALATQEFRWLDGIAPPTREYALYATRIS